MGGERLTKIVTNSDKGGRGSKKSHLSSDVIFERPLTSTPKIHTKGVMHAFQLHLSIGKRTIDPLMYKVRYSRVVLYCAVMCL